MSESFDPYHVWLGIPPESRPPTHYELLGISPNEHEKAVIEAAVLRQSGYVRNFQIGKYGKDATKLLHEIAAAKVCLLDGAKRAKYDAELKSRQPAAPNAVSQTPASPLALAIDLDELAAPVSTPPSAPLARSRQRRAQHSPTFSVGSKTGSFPWQTKALTVAALAIVSIVFLTLRPRGDDPLFERTAADPYRPSAAMHSDVPPRHGATAENSEPAPLSGTLLPAETRASDTLDNGSVPTSPAVPHAESIEKSAGAGVSGRYVRIELPRAEFLSLAEVQVFHGSHNVALGGEASQSSTWHTSVAALAIDGNTNGDIAAGSTTHTQWMENPWWEVDLKNEQPLDRIVVWSRTNNLEHRLAGFRVSILNDRRERVWVRENIDAPKPSIDVPLTLANAVELSPTAAYTLLGDAIAWYRAEGNADDSAGKHHGKLQGGARIAETKAGHAFEFDGKGGCLVVSEAPQLSAAGQITMMAWIRAEPTWSHVITAATDASGEKRTGFYLGIAPWANLYARFNAPGEPWDAHAAWGGESVYFGRWVHVSATYDGRMLATYANGVKVSASEVGNKPVDLKEARLVIGGFNAPGFASFKGMIDDIVLFDRGLTGIEIETIFRTTSLGKVGGGNLPRDKSAPPHELTLKQQSLMKGYTNARTIDVLPLINAKRDAAAGVWSKDNEGMHSPTDSVRAALRLPVAVPDEYRLIVVAERPVGWAGKLSCLSVGLVGPRGPLVATIDWGGKAGLARIDGRPEFNNDSTVECSELVVDGRPSVISYVVRRTGVDIDVDGKRLISWRGDYAQTGPEVFWQNTVPSPLRLFLGTHCDWHFKAIQLTPLTDAEDSYAQKEQPPQDLLKTIDLQKHARGGWAFDGPVLGSPASVSHAGVRFPGVVPDEYRLRIVAERPRGFQGPPQLHVGLVTRLSQATLVLDGDHKSGLEAVDGKMYHENATTFPGDLFIDGVESTIDCYVEKESIRVAFDGHTIIDWHGDLRQLTPTWSQFGAPKRTFWIGTHCNWRIKKMELLPLTKE